MVISVVLIFVDIKRIETHLSILQDELKETSTIIEILKNIYQTTDNPKVIQKQIQFMKDEKSCIEQKISTLNNAVDKFSRLNIDVRNTLDDAIELLKLVDRNY